MDRIYPSGNREPQNYSANCNALSLQLVARCEVLRRLALSCEHAKNYHNWVITVREATGIGTGQQLLSGLNRDHIVFYSFLWNAPTFPRHSQGLLIQEFHHSILFLVIFPYSKDGTFSRLTHFHASYVYTRTWQQELPEFSGLGFRRRMISLVIRQKLYLQFFPCKLIAARRKVMSLCCCAIATTFVSLLDLDSTLICVPRAGHSYHYKEFTIHSSF